LVVAFAHAHALGDSSEARQTFELVLLHELGHFAIGRGDYFQDFAAPAGAVGEERRRSEPEYLNAAKRVELAADSSAIAWINAAARTRDRGCQMACEDVEIILPGMLFDIFADEELKTFGQTRPRIVRDDSYTHPNLELRVAFMNYYMTHSAQSRAVVDEYLYNREVLPVRLQRQDPAIYQRSDKTLPDDRR
jgi:hypothetical protein